MREIMLVIHFIGLAMGVGTSFAFLFLGRAASKLQAEEAQKFMLTASGVSTMGHIGLTLLILSGGYLMTPYWGVLGTQPLLAAKLALVVVLTGMVALAGVASGRARRGDMVLFRKTARLGPVMLLTGIAILALAVLVFR
jgi:hypothetical protein